MTLMVPDSGSAAAYKELLHEVTVGICVLLGIYLTAFAVLTTVGRPHAGVIVGLGLGIVTALGFWTVRLSTGLIDDAASRRREDAWVRVVFSAVCRKAGETYAEPPPAPARSVFFDENAIGGFLRRYKVGAEFRVRSIEGGGVLNVDFEEHRGRNLALGGADRLALYRKPRDRLVPERFEGEPTADAAITVTEMPATEASVASPARLTRIDLSVTDRRSGKPLGQMRYFRFDGGHSVRVCGPQDPAGILSEARFVEKAIGAHKP